MSEDKKQIRARVLALRRGLNPETVARKSEAICRRLRATACWAKAPTLLSYVDSVENTDNEVPTRGLIAEALATGRQVLAPIALRGGVMVWSRLESLDELGLSRFGVLEPRPECRRLIEPPSDALCLTPGIAFTPTGYRIGYGGGFYDRFLAKFAGVSVGLAFSEQMIDHFPPESHDIPAGSVITDTMVYGALAEEIQAP